MSRTTYMRIDIKINIMQDIKKLEEILCKFCVSTINSFKVVHEKPSDNCDALNKLQNGPTFPT